MLLRGCAGRLAGKYQHNFRLKLHLLKRKNGRNKLCHFPNVM